jgi:hypothetical protein
MRTLAGQGRLRNHERVEDGEATQLVVEALFAVRTAVYEIHEAIRRR